MIYRLALIAGSAVVVLAISSVAVELVLEVLKPGRIEEISWWRIQALTVLPATLAAVVASAWTSGRRYWPGLDAKWQAICISFNSYVLYGLSIALIFGVEQALGDGSSPFDIPESILVTLLVSGLLTLFAVMVTALPVFLAEYAIIRFVRRYWQPALSTEVAP